MASALLVIDAQEGFLVRPPGAYQLDRLLGVISTLQRQARRGGVPVVFLQHDGPPGHPTEVGGPGWPIHAAVAPEPGETVIRKRSCDAFHLSALDAHLRSLGVDHVLVTGYATELCVDTTSRRGITLGYDVTLIADGHSTPDGGPPQHPAPDVRIKWTNHVLSKLINEDRAVLVRPSAEVLPSLGAVG
jgi:nicotinamidase-related amidase